MTRIALNALTLALVRQHQDIDSLDLLHVSRSQLAEFPQAGPREESQEGNPVGSLAAPIASIREGIRRVQRRCEKRLQFLSGPRSALVRRLGLNVQAHPW